MFQVGYGKVFPQQKIQKWGQKQVQNKYLIDLQVHGRIGVGKVNILIQNAWAQNAGGGDTLLSFLPLIIIFVVFYLVLIRPQTKKQKEHQEMVNTLEVGNEVVTAGGILGKIQEMNENYVHLEISENVTIKIQRQTISSLLPKGTIKKG